MSPQLILFFLLIPILIWAFNTFDNLIKLEYEIFHQQWLKDGQPSGLYWRPADYRPSLHSGFATQKSMLILLFKKPEWVASSAQACSLLKKYRILILTWNISVILWFFYQVWFSGQAFHFIKNISLKSHPDMVYCLIGRWRVHPAQDEPRAGGYPV